SRDGADVEVVLDETDGRDVSYDDPAYQPWSDVGIALATDPAVVEVGEPVDLSATVTNLGPSPAWGVEVSFELPSGATLLAAPTGCAEVGSEVRCVLEEPLAAGGEASVVVTVAFDP